MAAALHCTGGDVELLCAIHPHALCLSGIHHRDDVDRLFAGHTGICIAETGLQEIVHGASLELIAAGTETDEENEKTDSATLDALLPGELVTDAMAKDLPVELKGCSEQWYTEACIMRKVNRITGLPCAVRGPAVDAVSYQLFCRGTGGNH